MSRFSAVAAAAVEAGGEVVFVDQRFEVLQRPIGLGAGQRRREVVDDDGRGAALGLRAFAGIVDDEGIELRQRAHARSPDSSRPDRALALPGSHSRLPCLPLWMMAWAPKAMPKPEIEGEIAVRRHQRRIVIGGLRVDVVAARRLDRDGGIAVEADRKVETALGEEGVGFRHAPARRDLAADSVGQAGKEGSVVLEAQHRIAATAPRGIGRRPAAGSR